MEVMEKPCFVASHINKSQNFNDPNRLSYINEEVNGRSIECLHQKSIGDNMSGKIEGLLENCNIRSETEYKNFDERTKDAIIVPPVIENGHTDGVSEALEKTNCIEHVNSAVGSLSQSEQSIDLDLTKENVLKKSKVKKRVNICTDQDALEEVNINDIDNVTWRRGSETSDSVAMSNSIDGCLTMTGTIKRGKKAGQSVDVRLNMSREELEILEASLSAKKNTTSSVVKQYVCGLREGPHIILMTALFFPFAVIISSIYSFYVGTLTWYNVFTYYTEEKPIFCRVVVSPFLILLYPFLILVLTLGLGLYAGLIQISWFFESWYKEITDLEKGFYGWLCAALKHEDCSPYEVVVLTEIQSSVDTGVTVQSLSEDSTT